MTLKLHNSIPKDPYTKQLCASNAGFATMDFATGVVEPA